MLDSQYLTMYVKICVYVKVRLKIYKSVDSMLKYSEFMFLKNERLGNISIVL